MDRALPDASDFERRTVSQVGGPCDLHDCPAEYQLAGRHVGPCPRCDLYAFGTCGGRNQWSDSDEHGKDCKGTEHHARSFADGTLGKLDSNMPLVPPATSLEECRVATEARVV